MGTATILGDTYQTVIMPDGKEWIAVNFKHAATPGFEVNNSAANRDAYGRLYRHADIMATALPGGWRVATRADWTALINAVSGVVSPPTFVWIHLKSGGTVYWDSDTGYDTFGFAARGTGYCNTVPVYAAFRAATYFGVADPIAGQRQILVLSSTVANALWSNDPEDSYGFSYRLVRDYTPFHGFPSIDFGIGPEWGYEPKITPSLSWTKTASGLWRCLDDGAAFDAYDAEITVKVSAAVHSEWETFIAANRGSEVTYFAPAGVRPFGPHIDCTAGVQVVIGDTWATDWRVGITADCYTLHIPMRYVGGYTPTLATIPAVVARKYPTPTWFYPTKVHATEAGTATAAPRDTETQTTQIIIDNLDPTAAAEMVNWCLYQRGASFTYTPTANAFPFGVAVGNGPFTARLIGWTCQKPRPNRWDMTLDLARES